MSDMFIGTNGMADAWDSYIQVDKLTGYGTISKGWSTTATFAMGAANGSSTFNGTISNQFNQANYGAVELPVTANNNNNLSIYKLGTGTFSLLTTNYYMGGTTVSNGTFTVGGAGVLWSCRSPARGLQTATMAPSRW